MSAGGKSDDAKADDDVEVDGAKASQSAYRRDDYWREQARDSTEPDEVPEPPQGYRFAEPEKRTGEAKPDGETDEQGNAGGEDDARLVKDD